MYDKKYLYRMLCVYAFSVITMYVTRGNAFVLMVPFFLGALFKNKTDTLFACAVISTALLQTNAFLVPKPQLFAVTQRALFMILGLYAGLQLLGEKKHKIISSMMIMLLYLVYMFIPSSVGWYPMISYLKLILFITVFMGYMAIANRCIQNRKSNEMQLRSLFLATAIYYIGGSILLIPFPGISQMLPSEIGKGASALSLFKGMTLHSQALGPIACAFGLFAFGDLLFNIEKKDKLYVILLLCVPFLIYKTSSRTAMGTLVAGLCFAIYQLVNARNIKAKWKARVTSASLSVVALCSIFILVVPQMRNGIAKYILKYENNVKMSDVSIEQTFSTRQGKVDQQIRNFKSRPAIGWGFQVSEEIYMQVLQGEKISMLSAPVEKGVWVTAILEEGGVFGLALYLLFFFVVLGSLLSQKLSVACTVFVGMHISNLGEMSMFSLTGTGGLIWLLFFFAIVLDIAKKKREKDARIIVTQGYRPIYQGTGYNPMWR